MLHCDKNVLYRAIQIIYIMFLPYPLLDKRTIVTTINTPKLTKLPFKSKLDKSHD